MGNCTSSSDPAVKHDKHISRQNKRDQAREAAKIKLLLLGPGESGKSAIFKQIKLLHGTPISHEDLSFWRQVIHANICEAIQAIATAAEAMGMSDEVQAQTELELVKQIEGNFDLGAPISTSDSRSRGAVIEALWKDPGIQKVWERRSEFQVVDSHRAFLNDIGRIMSPSYVSTSQDTVLARVRSTGIIAEHIEMSGKIFAIYDVGGQRNERKKWIHVFDNVHAIIFVVGLSEYNQQCFEDTRQNRVQEGLEVFDWISGHALFLRTPLILFLNKSDLFAEKIKSHPIQDVAEWSDYAGGDYDSAWKYFFQKFIDIQVKHNPDKEIFPHVTNATDPTNMEFVFQSATEVILKANLENSGFGGAL